MHPFGLTLPSCLKARRLAERDSENEPNGKQQLSECVYVGVGVCMSGWVGGCIRLYRRESGACVPHTKHDRYRTLEKNSPEQSAQLELYVLVRICFARFALPNVCFWNVRV